MAQDRFNLAAQEAREHCNSVRPYSKKVKTFLEYGLNIIEFYSVTRLSDEDLLKYRMSRRLSFVLGLAFVLGVFHAALAVQWVRVDRQPPAWDPAVHLGTALDYREAFAAGRWLDLIRTKPRPGHPQYPIAYHYTLLPVLGADAPHRAAVIVNLLYFFLFVGAAGWIAWQLGGAGACAATLCAAAFSPGLLYKFREPFPDLALCAWTTLAYALALRSRLFLERRWAFATGVAAGLAVLSKWGAVLYLAPAVAFGVYDKKTRRHCLAAVALGAAMALPWYLVNSASMLPRIWTSVMLGHRGMGYPATGTIANWMYYPRWLADCFSWTGVLLMLAGCAWSLRKSPSRARLLVAGWLAFSYLFTSLVPSKDNRYFLPAALALPALGFAALPPPALAAAAGIALLQDGALRKPDASEWHAESVLAEIESRRASRGAGVAVLANHQSISATTLGWLARHRGLERIHFGGHQSEIPEWADFALVKTAEPGVFLSDATRGILAQEKDVKSFFRSVFQPARRWPLPDGSELVLYEQRPDLALIKSQRRFAALSVRNATLVDARLKPLGPGRFELTAERLEIPKLGAAIRGIRAELVGARLLERGGKIYVLGLERVKLLRARGNEKEFSEALSRRARLPIELLGSDGALHVGARLGPVMLKVALTLEVRGGALELSVRKARLGGVPLPLRFAYRQDLSARPPFQPYAIELGTITVSSEVLSVGT